MATPTCSFEIEVTLSGHVTPYRPATGPSYASGGDPAEGGEVEDLDVEDIGIVGNIVPGSRPIRWMVNSILTGVDTKNPEIQKLFANLIALKHQEFCEAVAEAES